MVCRLSNGEKQWYRIFMQYPHNHHNKFRFHIVISSRNYCLILHHIYSRRNKKPLLVFLNFLSNHVLCHNTLGQNQETSLLRYWYKTPEVSFLRSSPLFIWWTGFVPKAIIVFHEKHGVPNKWWLSCHQEKHWSRQCVWFRETEFYFLRNMSLY